MRRILPTLVLALALCSCTKYSIDDPILKKTIDQLTEAEIKRMVAVMTTQYGKVVFELHPEWGLMATKNFIRLTKGGYYDGLTICDIRPGVWIRGGAPQPDECKGTPGYIVPLETPTGPVLRGMVGLHHYDMLPKQGTSQFFIMLGDAINMNNGYTIFGKVIEGMPAVDRIGQLKSAPGDSPVPFKPYQVIVIEDLHLEVRK